MNERHDHASVVSFECAYCLRSMMRGAGTWKPGTAKTDAIQKQIEARERELETLDAPNRIYSLR